MNDFFEIDFLDVETDKSGDAISLRYQVNGITSIHVVDGGFQDTGKKVVEHIRQYYDNPNHIDRVIVTHPDGDHAGGLRTVLEEFRVGELWMLRPWIYAHEIISRFSNFSSVDNLRRRLKQIYPNLSALEAIALERGIPIREPFQGAVLGAFTILAPTKKRYLDLIVSSERTPESPEEVRQTGTTILTSFLHKAATEAVRLLKAAWGVEAFSPEETSAENEMSAVQYANIAGQRIVLTGDAGRAALTEAADYAPYVGLQLPGIHRFQVPHHGSRRNVSTELLNRWLGSRLPNKPQPGQETFTAVISSAKKDEDHPRKAVIRALIHRGAKVLTTEGKCICISRNKPRAGWVPATPEDYPEEQEN
ncbi:Metallo-beta-lactamase superfamily protein [Nitrospira tepida]|uniref:Metallo-beta-lactamase superfamily protein n=1 Tax=Nitrospira tepida TaxID=2973512 RepID=A0AA86MXE4_9BACT|nr:MBL fold metallo-hydrolase [Nitrospira tepida]CAI4030825.1 Metallo-beta-lactamase superfamily protein [Nitrospira tepida]